VKIGDIFDLDLLLDMVNEGMVRIQFHPSFPLCIATYTKDAVVKQEWNPVTTACRGLIWHEKTGEVLARPFPKFHNLGHPLAREDYGAQVEVTDKMDGSLGIGYVWAGKCYIATKGSFDSPQAVEATRILHTYYPDWLPPAGVTPLWEIIYPENRIVLDYGQSRYLALLEGMDIQTGKTFVPDDPDGGIWSNWNGAACNLVWYHSLGEVVSAMPRKNAEGYVVRYLDDDTRIKVKQQDYIDKHKLVFHLSEKTVWESLKDGRFDEYKAGMPDEFHEWMDITALPFLQKFREHVELINESRFSPEIDALFERGDRSARKELAQAIRDAPRWVQKSLWCLWDGMEFNSYIYKQFEPKGQTKVAKP
jgi:RNA ligase